MRKIFICILMAGLIGLGNLFAVETKHETSFVVFPVDCNSNPPMLFGGKVLAEMDRCAAICARRALYSSEVKDYVTVGINNVKFLKAGQVKDLIYVRGEIVKFGTKSITINMTVERELGDLSREVLCTAEYTFVAYDVNLKKAMEHGLSKAKP